MSAAGRRAFSLRHLLLGMSALLLVATVVLSWSGAFDGPLAEHDERIGILNLGLALPLWLLSIGRAFAQGHYGWAAVIFLVSPAMYPYGFFVDHKPGLIP